MADIATIAALYLLWESEERRKRKRRRVCVHNILRRRPQLAVERLSICLQFLATGDSFRTIVTSFPGRGLHRGFHRVRWVVDADKCFCIIDVGGYGRTSDGGILANSVFGQALRAGDLKLPADRVLSAERGPLPHVFWRIYRRVIEVRPELAERCVKATCVLHNLLRRTAPTAAVRDCLPVGVVLPLPGLGRVAAKNNLIS
ncbi:unnamed protein product [Boreogadus saida]